MQTPPPGLKFCKDCKWFEPAKTVDGRAVPSQCTHPQNVEWDLVTGMQKRQLGPHQMRDHQGPCTRQATLFEAKS